MAVPEDLRALVVRRAKTRCEYCTIRQADDPVFRFPIDRIISGQHGGEYSAENTALACHNCNQKKGPNIASASGETPGTIVPLFNPRRDVWAEHFYFEGPLIRGLTLTGKVTVALLDMNAPQKVRLRTAVGPQRYSTEQ